GPPRDGEQDEDANLLRPERRGRVQGQEVRGEGDTERGQEARNVRRLIAAPRPRRHARGKDERGGADDRARAPGARHARRATAWRRIVPRILVAARTV